ncbi:hypothetical protein ABZ490_08760 [Streptomyces sp. NPDC005811]|uniref:hypothetical protein n=1 Tax=Streptomyces sp. NPDC005811 TaxID=3154565 RepID=UPI0033F76985
MKRMRIGRRSGSAATILLALALVAVSASPASADSDKSIVYGSRGYMYFTDNGDVFKVCDTKADGYGMDGYLNRRNTITGGGFTELWRITASGNGNCTKKGEDIGNLYQYQMSLWWRGNYSDGGTNSDWFNE